MTLSEDWRTGRHVLYQLHAHLVFITKYRRDAISEHVGAEIGQACQDVAEQFEVTIDAYEHDHDHVHLLVTYPPKVALSKLVNSMKGVSSRRVRALGLPEVKRVLWGDHFWSPSYAVISCGGAPLDVVRQYVENQRSPNRRRGRPKQA